MSPVRTTACDSSARAAARHIVDATTNRASVFTFSCPSRLSCRSERLWRVGGPCLPRRLRSVGQRDEKRQAVFGTKSPGDVPLAGRVFREQNIARTERDFLPAF